MSEATLIITFEHTDIMKPRPWPVMIDADNKVLSGLGRDDGATLIGFGPAGEERITLFAEDARQSPQRAVGLTPTFVGGGGMFLWQQPVAVLTPRRGVDQ